MQEQQGKGQGKGLFYTYMYLRILICFVYGLASPSNVWERGVNEYQVNKQ